MHFMNDLTFLMHPVNDFLFFIITITIVCTFCLQARVYVLGVVLFFLVVKLKK